MVERIVIVHGIDNMLSHPQKEAKVINVIFLTLYLHPGQCVCNAPFLLKGFPIFRISRSLPGNLKLDQMECFLLLWQMPQQ